MHAGSRVAPVPDAAVSPEAADASETVARAILGMRVDATSYPAAVDRIMTWARNGERRYVCVATVNNVMEAFDRADFRRMMNEADLVTPDGMPLVWGLKLLGVPAATRVYGPDLTWLLCERAAREGVRVGFYGGTPDALEGLVRNLRHRLPNLQIVHRFSPPFRPPTPDEDRQIIADINASGAQILFVGLGSPKQDAWMAHHLGRVHPVMIGVGAAFDLLAHKKPRAPRIMQEVGLEWLFRLVTEPRRVWRRYLRHNPRFVAFFLAQLLSEGGPTPRKARRRHAE